MKKIKLYSYYFPNWHQDDRNDNWHGKGWTEWEVLKCARARFVGHKQPLIPTWGYEDESKPEVMEKKIETAKKYGIDGFIFDTYYYDDGSYRIKCIDEGFLKAKNSKDFEFAILWCNHDAIYAHPSPRVIISPVLKSGAVNKESFVKITNVFIDKYFTQPNYIRVDGKLFFAIYNVYKLIGELGGIDECIAALDDLRERVREKGLGELFIGTVSAIMEDNFSSYVDINNILNKLKIDISLRYWWPVKFEDKRLTIEYDEFAQNGLKAQKEDFINLDIPCVCHMMSGLDQSPRTIQSEIYESLNIYPWYTICVGSTPEKYGKAFKEMYELAKNNGRSSFMTCIWNEWTEGNYLEPEEEYGYGFLEEIKKVMEE